MKEGIMIQWKEERMEHTIQRKDGNKNGRKQYEIITIKMG